ncbi:MAG: 4'-phosphopantetheinyl transferase superfamily protein [Ramlibacter sp.]
MAGVPGGTLTPYPTLDLYVILKSPIAALIGEIHVWLARPDEVRDTQWGVLDALLDKQEQERAGRFKLPVDRRSYVLAHALRRRVLSQALAVEPAAIILADKAGAKPVLIEPKSQSYFFSHSRSRSLVAFAITALQPVGIDVEALQDRAVDFELLSRFVALPDAGCRTAELGPDPARQFFYYWTALEAFWKASGSGLVSGSPRIRCAMDGRGGCELSLEGDAPDRPKARVAALEAVPGYAVALALAHPPTGPVNLEPPAIALHDGNQLIH